MVNSVTMPSAYGASGATYTDDADPDTGLDNNGHRVRLVPMLADSVAVSGYAKTQADTAVAAAASALGAPGTQSTSTTPNTIAGTGDKTFETQTGKLWSKGQPLVCASDADPANQMSGFVKSYDSGTGALVVTMTSSLGSGSHSDWVIALTGAAGGVQPTRQVLAGGIATGGGNLGADVTITVTKAAAADVAAGTDDTKAVTAKAIQDSMAPQTLTDAATIAWNMATKKSALVVLGGNRTLGQPTNFIRGDVQQLEIWQDATGGRTLAFAACYEFGVAGTPTLSTGANKMDLLTVRCIDATGGAPRFRCSFQRDA